MRVYLRADLGTRPSVDFQFLLTFRSQQISFSRNSVMAQLNIAILPATEEDGPELASLITISFAASDAAFPLIWGGSEEGTHDIVALKGLFSPVQKEGRMTVKAVDNDKIVGFATWELPLPKVFKDEILEGKRKRDGLPQIPGVNTALWSEKMNDSKEFSVRDVDEEKDMRMFLFYINCNPSHAKLLFEKE
jgi:hypothetical protein